MIVNHKEKYLECCSKVAIPIFMQPWWLDTACKPMDWDVVLDIQKDEIRGALVIFKKSKYGITYIVQPPFTFYSGIWFNPNFVPSNVSNRRTFQREVSNNIILSLPSFDYLSLKLKYDLLDSLVFSWKDFMVQPMYSYQLYNIENHEVIFNNYNEITKRKIKKSAANYTIQHSDDAKITAQVWESTFVRKGLKSPYSITIFQDLINKTIENKQGANLHLLDLDGKLQAVAFIVWDHEMAYNITTAYIENSTLTDASCVLLHEAIKLASEHVHTFDFEGSMIAGVEQLFRGFGGTLTPYFSIKKSRNKLYHLVNEFVKII